MVVQNENTSHEITISKQIKQGIDVFLERKSLCSSSAYDIKKPSIQKKTDANL